LLQRDAKLGPVSFVSASKTKLGDSSHASTC
jgi:hypothetical protein